VHSWRIGGVGPSRGAELAGHVVAGPRAFTPSAPHAWLIPPSSASPAAPRAGPPGTPAIAHIPGGPSLTVRASSNGMWRYAPVRARSPARRHLLAPSANQLALDGVECRLRVEGSVRVRLTAACGCDTAREHVSTTAISAPVERLTPRHTSPQGGTPPRYGMPSSGDTV